VSNIVKKNEKKPIFTKKSNKKAQKSQKSAQSMLISVYQRFEKHPTSLKLRRTRSQSARLRRETLSMKF
jgi:hypothetical protein